MGRRAWIGAAALLSALISGAAAQPACDATVSDAADAAALAAAQLSGCETLDVTWTGHVPLSSTIEVSAGVVMTVTGAGLAAVADGGGAVQLFFVSAGGTLHLRDLRLTGGYASRGGAVGVAMDGVATFSGCGFFDNAAVGDYPVGTGGAIWSKGMVKSITGCVLANNSARRGGAFYTLNASTTISSTEFSENSAEEFGGSIVSNGVVLITNSTFRGCSAIAGGAVYLTGDGDVTFDATTFSLNSATGEEGAGGGIYVKAATELMCNKCIFDSCDAAFGGGVFLTSDNNRTAAPHGFVSSDFTNCTALKDGGSIYANSNISIVGGAFVTSSASEVGGAVYVNSGASAVVSGSRFVNSSAVSGAAVFNAGTTTLVSSLFFDNAASSSGGAIYSEGDVPRLDSCRFVANSAGQSGGAGFFGGSLHAIGGSSFERNAAGLSGGGLYLAGVCGTVFNCSFLANSAVEGNGGAVNSELASTDEGRFESCVFANSSAGGDGGAIMGPVSFYLETTVSSSMTTTTTSFATFPHKHPHETVTLHVRAVNVSACEFTANIAEGLGGAVRAQEMVAASSLFSRNEARSGGAIWASEFTADSESHFDSNVAAEAGGAVFLGGVESISWPLSRFGENEAGCCFEPAADGQSCADVAAQLDARDLCCTAGNWFVDAACTACPDGFSCDEVGLVPETAPMDSGWWRGDLSATEARPCLNGAACSGGEAALANYCSTGYRGPLCATCGPGYTSGIAYECHECGEASVAASACVVVAAALIFIGVVCYIVLDLHGVGASLHIPRDGKMGKLWNKISSFRFGKLRAPVVVLQIVTQYVAVTGTTYPPLYRKFLAVASAVTINLQLMVSLGCLFSLDFYGYLLLVTIPPLLVVALLVASVALARCWVAKCTAEIGPRRSSAQDLLNSPPEPPSESRWERTVNRHWLVFMVFTFLIYSTVSTTVFQTFACDDLRDIGAAQYLRADYSIECYTQRHKLYMVYATVMALVYPIGIPVVYGWMLWCQRGRILVDCDGAARLADPTIRTTRFLWQPYKREVFWWELAECVRRLCLTGVLVFILPGTIGQSAWASVFSVASLAAVFYFSPHEDAIDAHVYCLGCLIIFCSMFFSVMTKAEDGVESEKAVSALLVVLNVVMVAATLMQCFYAAVFDPASIRQFSFFGLAAVRDCAEEEAPKTGEGE